MINKDFFKALAILTGTIIGVGIFSLPFITAQVGFWVMLAYFLTLGGLVILVHLIYGEVTLRTQGRHRLPGYAEKYLGRKGKIIASFSDGLGLIGALLAYLIVGSSFLSLLLAPVFGGSDFIYLLIYFSAGAFLIFLGITSIAQVESFLLILFFVALGLIFSRSFSLIEIKNLFNFDWQYVFLPYGAVLFSLAGFPLVPEIKEMLTGQSKALKKVIFWAVLISAFTYLVFIFLVLGITGQNTSKEAISGLRNFLSSSLISLILSFGVLTTFTSFITIGLTLKKIFWYDWKINKHFAWFLACFVPLFFYFLGLKDFIAVISLTGGVMLAISAIIIILIFLKLKISRQSRLFIYSLILFFLLGIIYEIYYYVI